MTDDCEKHIEALKSVAFVRGDAEAHRLYHESLVSEAQKQQWAEIERQAAMEERRKQLKKLIMAGLYGMATTTGGALIALAAAHFGVRIAP